MTKLRDLIKECSIRNKDKLDIPLLGVNKDKEFMPSVANIVGTDLSKYKIVKKGQFATNLMHVDRDKIVPVSCLTSIEKAIVSPAYNVFEIIDENIITKEYLMLIFKTKRFDDYAWFLSGSSIRGNLDWNRFLDMEIDLISLEKQKEIIKRVKNISNYIELKEKQNKELFNLAQLSFAKNYSSFDNFDILKESEIGKIPENYELVRLFDNVDFLNGYAFEGGSTLTAPCENTYKIFKQGMIKQGGGLNFFGVKNYVPKDFFASINKYVLKPGDVLMCMTDMKDPMALLGHTAIVFSKDEYVLNQRVGLLRVKQNSKINPLFLYLLTNDQNFLRRLRKKARPSVQVNLSKNDIIDIEFAIPKNSNFLIDFTEKISPLFDTINRNDQIILSLTNLRDLIISKI